MGIQVTRDHQAVGIVLQHAHRESLDAARNQEAIHGRQSGTCGALDKINFLGVFLASQYHRAPRRVAVAVEILGHGMDYDVSTELDGPLKIRAQESVVPHYSDISLTGQFSERGNIGDPHRRISGSFDVQHFGVGPKGRYHCVRRGSVYKAEFQSKVNQELRGEPKTAAVYRFGEHHMVARPQQPKDGVDASHSGSKYVSAVAVLESGDGALQSLSIGMIGARVVVTVFIFPQLFVYVSGCLIDWRDDGAGGRIWFLADVDGVSGETHVYSSWLDSKICRLNHEPEWLRLP